MFKKMKFNPLPAVFLTVLMDSLGFGILIPIIPQLLANPKSPFFLLPASMSLNQGYILLGIMVAIFPLGIFFAAPVLGQLSDRYGRKKLWVLSVTGTCLSYIIFALGIITRSITLLIIGRALDGITGGNISIAQAAISDVTKPQDRAKNFGLIGAAFGIGFILGPFLGGFLSDPARASWFHAATPFWFAAFLSFVNVISLVFFVPETHLTPKHGLKIQWERAARNILHAANMKGLRVIFAANFLYQAGFSFFVSFFGVFLTHRFGFDQGHIGNYFSFIGVWMIFTQLVLVRLISRRASEQQVIRFTMFGSGIILLIFFLINRPLELFLVAPFFAFCNGLSVANIAALISRSADQPIQGEVLGINASVQALGQFIPPVLSGMIAVRFTPETPVVVASMCVLSAGFVFLYFYRTFARAQK